MSRKTLGSCLVVGVVRDCGGVLAQEVARLRLALAGARPVRWLLIESDSIDDTRGVLEALAGSVPDFRYLTLGELDGAIPERTARIAHCRNAYLEAIETDPLYADVDHVVMADLDGINDRISPAAMESCWDRSDWDGCMANQAGPYYDVWALRHPIWSPGDGWEQMRFLAGLGADAKGAQYAGIFSKMVQIPSDRDWIAVDSAFGGLAIYRRAALSGMRYAGFDEAGAPICEHVMFHRQMRDAGARLFINPRLINAGYTEHSEHARHHFDPATKNFTPSDVLSLTASLLDMVPQLAGEVERLVLRAKARNFAQ